MKCTVNLGADKFVCINDRFCAEDNIIIAFESSEYPLDEMHVTVTNGEVTRRKTVKDGMIDISEYCKKAAVIEIGVELVLRGAVAKAWLLEPFVVKELNGGYEMIPEIALLRKELKTMKTIIKELNSKIKDTM